MTAYEDEEKKRLESQLKDYEKQLERDTKNEQAKHQRNVEQLNQRKEDMVKKQVSEKANKATLCCLEQHYTYKALITDACPHVCLVVYSFIWTEMLR